MVDGCGESRGVPEPGWRASRMSSEAGTPMDSAFVLYLLPSLP